MCDKVMRCRLFPSLPGLLLPLRFRYPHRALPGPACHARRSPRRPRAERYRIGDHAGLVAAAVTAPGPWGNGSSRPAGCTRRSRPAAPRRSSPACPRSSASTSGRQPWWAAAGSSGDRPGSPWTPPDLRRAGRARTAWLVVPCPPSRSAAQEGRGGSRSRSPPSGPACWRYPGPVPWARQGGRSTCSSARLAMTAAGRRRLRAPWAGAMQRMPSSPRG
jgi:hypothetical protein